MRRQVALRQGLVDGFSDTDFCNYPWHPLCQAFPLAHYDLSRVMIRYWANFAAKETKALIASDEDPTRLFAGKSTQYRKSKSLPKFTGEAMRTCATINRIFFDDPDEAYRLFHELVPDAGEGVQFTPPFNVDYGIGLTIGRGTFLNKDFMVCGGGYVTLGAVASVPSLRVG